MNDILTLTKSYDLHSWISIEDAIVLEAKQLVLDHLGESVYLYSGGTNKQGKRSSIATSSIIVIDGDISNRRGRHVPVLTNSNLFQRDMKVCAYCIRKYDSTSLTRDHVIPVSKGGKNTWTNCVTACKPCNGLKNDIMPGSNLPDGSRNALGKRKMELAYVPYIPCKAESLIMKNRNVKADQMAFLLDRIENKNVSRIWASKN